MLFRSDGTTDFLGAVHIVEMCHSAKPLVQVMVEELMIEAVTS